MSQFDEDVIVPKLFSFCEFGAADGVRLSNTTMQYKTGWSGIYIEPGKDYAALVINRPNAVCLNELVTTENVNDLVPYVDLLSIDVDGNDYWIWQAYSGNAKVVIIESNPKMENIHPYDPEFVCNKKEPFGAPPNALRELAKRKGYKEICMTGVNLIFAYETTH